MNNHTTKKQWGLPTLCVIDSNTINGGGQQASKEVGKHSGKYTVQSGAVTFTVGKSTFGGAHS